MIYRFLIGTYNLDGYPDQILSEGTFATVRTMQKCKYAFKILKSSQLHKTMDACETGNSEYQRDIKVLKRIHHRHVAKLIGAMILEEGEEDFRLCVMQELCTCNLFDYLQRKGCAMRIEKLREFAIQITSGLSALRDKHIYHIDLKPENILHGKDKYFKLAEVDTYKLSPNMFPLLREKILSNAPSCVYMAPELVKAAKSSHSSSSGSASRLKKFRAKLNREKANVYSLGVILYTCLHPMKTTVLSDVIHFIKQSNQPALGDIISLMAHMLKDQKTQRASLDQVAFSAFFLRKVLPTSVRIIGKIDQYRQHDETVSSSTSLGRTSSSISMSEKQKSGPYALSFKDNIICLRSAKLVNGWEETRRIKDFMSLNPCFNTITTKVYVFTGTNSACTEEQIGYNKTALTDITLQEEFYVAKDTEFVRDALNDTNISQDEIRIISLGDFTNDYYGFCKQLEGYDLHANDILITAFCHAQNSDVLKVIQSYKNQRELYGSLRNLNRSMMRQNIINISGSILRNFRKTQRFFWDYQLLAKTDIPAEQLSTPETVHVDMRNFQDLIPSLRRRTSPNIVLLSFSICGNVSLTSYLNSLNNVRVSDRCTIQ